MKEEYIETLPNCYLDFIIIICHLKLTRKLKSKKKMNFRF